MDKKSYEWFIIVHEVRNEAMVVFSSDKNLNKKRIVGC